MQCNVPFRSIRHITRHRPQCCVENWPLSQVTKTSVEEEHVTMLKSKKSVKKAGHFTVFTTYFTYFGPRDH